MQAFKGTWALIRLALRRDRIKLPLWIFGIAGMFAVSVASTLDLYAEKASSQLSYALTTAPSIVSRVFGGPIDGPNIGAIVLNETFLFTALAAAFMSTLAVVRHTRQNEETGRSELIGSAVVGRHASLMAALLVTLGANLLLGGAVALILLGNDLPSDGSVATGIAIAGIGVMFAAVAALTAQISETARGANSLAAIGIGVAFLLRAIGDGMGKLTQEGTAIVSSFPTWLSPIGWSQQVHPFTQHNWWTFILFGSFTLTILAVTFALVRRRDIGLGLLPVRLGPAHASKNLLSPLGLARRLQKGILKGWAVAVLVLGATYGLVAKEFETLLTENEDVAELMQQLGGGSKNITDALLGVLLFFMAITISAYTVQALQRLRSEEAGGQLEPILATATSRYRWIFSHIIVVVLGALTLTAITGLSLSTAYVLAAGEPAREILSLTGAMLAHLPSILVLVGFSVFVFAFLPRMAIGLAWGGFAFCLLVGQFGRLLHLPQWAINISPFSHTPSVPAEAVTILPLAALVGVFVALTVLGLGYFRRRDITTA